MQDYKTLGFKCGLEIHQQLDGRKLFCSCPTINSSEKPDFSIKRKLRAVAGETGAVDRAADHEMKKARTFTYIGSNRDVCLVELDEEPPHPMNKEALMTAIKVAMLLDAKVVDEIHVMRKTVVDGSNVSGFQRTALIATDGKVQTKKGTVMIPSICLEEEAAQKVEEKDGIVTYKLDRLGIPLIEIGTDASITDPEHAKEVAQYLGMVLRSTGNAKRGIGTIRQDVNVSIKGGARVEIKGFQDLRSIPRIIEHEVNRQKEEISSGKKPEQHVRKAEQDMTTSYLRPMPGAARMYPETDVPAITVTAGLLKSIEKPMLLSEQQEKLEKDFGLPKPLAKQLVGDDRFTGYVRLFKNVEPKVIANTLIEIPKEISSRLKLDISRIEDKHFESAFSFLNDRKIDKSAIIDILSDACRGNKIDLSRYETASGESLRKDIEAIVKEKPGLTEGGYMGLIMAKYRGKADGKAVIKILKEIL